MNEMKPLGDEDIARRTPEPPLKTKESRHREWAARGLLLLLVITAVVGFVLYALSGRYETTENAFVQADKITISAEVEGRAVEVLAKTNSVVVAGDVLFRIDDRAYQLALIEAEAELDATRNQIEALRAEYQEKRAAIETAEENTAYSEREFKRQEALVTRGVASKSKFDSAQHDMTLAQRQESEIRQELAGINARLGGDPTLPTDQNPEVLQAMAAIDQARLALSHTIVRAPRDAVIAAVNLQPGEIVELGQPLVALIAQDGLWITANFKETDMTNVRVGQKAVVTFDVYPGHKWNAVVGSISPATGSEFALIPPQNASGNWVKVVQRIPVRVYLDDYRGDPPVRAGLSAFVEIDTENSDGLMRFFENLL